MRQLDRYYHQKHESEDDIVYIVHICLSLVQCCHCPSLCVNISILSTVKIFKCMWNLGEPSFGKGKEVYLCADLAPQ